MARQVRFNAFDRNCVGHQSPSFWKHPRDRSFKYKDLDYWQGLARTLERGVFDGIFIADVIGYCDVYKENNFHPAAGYRDIEAVKRREAAQPAAAKREPVEA